MKKYFNYFKFFVDRYKYYFSIYLGLSILSAYWRFIFKVQSELMINNVINELIYQIYLLNE